nr:MAG: E6 protein [Neophocaena asiaeorientalis asiaeorientalis papillomavirus 4]
MAEDEPTCIRELCRKFGICLQELLIPCIFCRNHVPEFDLWSFSYKQLKVVWRKGYPFAACRRCTEVVALVDSWRKFECSAYARTVEAETGKPLGDIAIRCVGCLKKLTDLEKIRQVDRGRHFHRIASNWRGFCLNCLDGPPPLVRWFLGIHVPRPRLIIGWGFDPPTRDEDSSSSASSWTTTSTESESPSLALDSDGEAYVALGSDSQSDDLQGAVGVSAPAVAVGVDGPDGAVGSDGTAGAQAGAPDTDAESDDEPEYLI